MTTRVEMAPIPKYEAIHEPVRMLANLYLAA
jgi:hypothetical protein